MAEFINTIDALGDDVVIDSIIDRSITEFKDDKLTTVGERAFYGCTALETVDLPSVTAIGRAAFAQCSALKGVNLPLLVKYIAEYTSPQYTFEHCKSLTRIVLPKITAIGYATFNGCSSLRYVDFSALSTISTGTSWMMVFGACSALKAVIIRSETMANLLQVQLGPTFSDGTCYIYVPRPLVDSYKTATNWSTYANQFRALEDYTVDGTTTGELDETKI